MRHKRYGVTCGQMASTSNIRDDERQCILVMIGVTDTGHKGATGDGNRLPRIGTELENTDA